MESFKRKYYFDPQKGMGIMVKTITRLIVGIVFLYGVNLALRGHLIPGGGIAGGGTIALALLSLILAFGKETALKNINSKKSTVFLTLGLMMFLILCLVEFWGGELIFNNLLQAGVIRILKHISMPFFNVAICLIVGSGIYTIFITLIMLRPEKGQKP